ncbi:E3 ubiquitin-protein ligase TRIM71-like [Magallana gigas]|uniref:E3 ubiquitin-protein ligase TRIM71-like n=1 Tax=Magallana gigas TaxID=29159 RepID=UPI00333F79C1
MDPEYSLQDVVRCHSCDTPKPPLHCNICEVHLCRDCEKNHLLDDSIKHNVVLFEFRGCITKCQKHSTEICDRYCEQCDIPICVHCTSSKRHRGHVFVDVLKTLETQKHVLNNDLKELTLFICPYYEKIASNIPVLKENLEENANTLLSVINKQGDDLHREIDKHLEKLKRELYENKSKSVVELEKKANKIKHTLSEIKKIIENLNKLLISNDVSIVFAYKSRNAEFRKLPPEHTIALPSFTPQNINAEQINQLFGSLSVPSTCIKTEQHANTMDFQGAKASTPERPLIDEPHIIKDINTEYGGSKKLTSVSCLSDDQIWMSGFEDNIMRLYNLQGELVKSIQTKSGKHPSDIAVTKSGDLVYTDCSNKTINIVKNTKIETVTVIRLRGWRPQNVCTTFSGDFLVAMYSDDFKQAKVVRYSGNTETQRIQYNDKEQPLFSSAGLSKYISENKNLDICVADYKAGAVVVVDHAGKFRFTYTGCSSTARTKKPFNPVGITTDSQSRILTAEHYMHCIYILDRDGQFLRFIDNCHLQHIWGVCLDSSDNLFVAEHETAD